MAPRPPRSRGPRDEGPRPVGAALERLLGAMRAPSVDMLELVFNRWDDVVGPDLAAHCRPSAIDGDRLVVSADDPTWASEFRWLENEVVARLAEIAGSDRIAAVSVRVRRRE